MATTVDLPTAVVIDPGSTMVRAGFAGQSEPLARVVPVVGRKRPPPPKPKRKDLAGNDVSDSSDEDEAKDDGPSGLLAAMEAMASKEDVSVGATAIANAKTLELTWAVQQGFIRSWKDMEHVLDAVYEDHLMKDAAEHPVVLVEPPDQVRKLREEATQVMFEHMDVPGLFNACSSVMALYAHGLTTGLVVEVGEFTSRMVPVYEGHVHRVRVTPWGVCGPMLDTFMVKEYARRGEDALPKAYGKACKQAMAVVVEDFEAATAAAASTPEFDEAFTLPDGSMLTLSTERFRVPELMFKPSLGDDVGLWDAFTKPLSMQAAINAAVKKCPLTIREDMYANVLLTGGSMLLSPKTLAARVHKELSAVAPEGMPVSVVGAPKSQDVVWVGASILAAMPNFQPLWITKAEYEEVGVDIAHRRCM